MKKRTFLKFTLWTASIAILLFAALVIHIALVIPPTKKMTDTRQRQLSRIDFKQELSTADAEKIKGVVGAMEGVESAYYNPENGAFVFVYAIDKQNAKTVYSKIMSTGDYKAEPYVVDAETAKGGCPAHADKKSFTTKLAQAVSNIIH